MENDFVNRKAEFMFIKEWINTPTTKNKGIFVYAKSGIGKSRFVSEFFNSELPNYIKIKVEMLGTDTSSISSYSFLMSLYRKMISTTEKNGQLSLLPPIIGAEDAIGDLPPLQPGEDGSSYNYRFPAANPYQKFMRGLITADEYLKSYY